MNNKNKLFRRLSIYFLLMAMIALTLFIFVMFLMAKDDAFVCSSDTFLCQIDAEHSFYRSAIYGLGFSTVLLVLLSYLFSEQIEFVTEYSGYIKSVSEIERDRIKEANQSSSALKEYFLHIQALEQEEKNKNNQLTIDEFVVDVEDDSELNEENTAQLTDEEVTEEESSVETLAEEVSKEGMIEELAEEEIAHETIIADEDEKEFIKDSIINTINKETSVEEMIDVMKIEESPKNELPVVSQDKEELNDEFIKEELIAEEDINVKNNVATLPIKSDDDNDTLREYRVVPRKTKKDFEQIIFKETALNKTKSKLFLKTLLNVITEEISQGNIIDLKDFGKFRKQTYKSRNAINPKTKEKIIIEEHSVARFYANKSFTSYLRENNKINPDVVKVKKIKKISPVIVPNNIENEIAKVKPEQTLTKINSKKEIILQIQKKSKLSKNKSKEFLNAFIQVVIDDIAKGNSVKIPTIGSLNIVSRAQKRAINPQTKEVIQIPEHKALKLKFSKDFKQIINQKK